eukprot:CAMPEP_0114393520 /NCGR_PEP_ID=MMETSP0102-20121206/11565_1 /TAXON_ID=38822 ORGANISM="Pteridomonas danica, Strain PT" /NCGR_SAMPLE_ID=MMETSP0102 /ASSEMBLY_ACC=CAM_ASM_000212 /LENGTH=43 /DNA_ID= /DNA_START= /DNA_END= /DNA_ORIENTATION=
MPVDESPPTAPSTSGNVGNDDGHEEEGWGESECDVGGGGGGGG